jgi:hypothetical protein
MLEELKDIDSRNLKQLYNYNMTSRRENDENKIDFAEEFQYNKIHKDGLMQLMVRQQDARASYRG